MLQSMRSQRVDRTVTDQQQQALVNLDLTVSRFTPERRFCIKDDWVINHDEDILSLVLFAGV